MHTQNVTAYLLPSGGCHHKKVCIVVVFPLLLGLQMHIVAPAIWRPQSKQFVLRLPWRFGAASFGCAPETPRNVQPQFTPDTSGLFEAHGAFICSGSHPELLCLYVCSYPLVHVGSLLSLWSGRFASLFMVGGCHAKKKRRRRGGNILQLFHFLQCQSLLLKPKMKPFVRMWRSLAVPERQFPGRQHSVSHQLLSHLLALKAGRSSHCDHLVV
uniref:Uncharacterized protein n=1 Tax=Eutreptiella gymnastica TaxID=73025 RepID=A0A7S4LHP5_9EUGL